MGRSKGGTNEYWSKEEKLRIVKKITERGYFSKQMVKKTGNPLTKYSRRKELTQIEQLEYENISITRSMSRAGTSTDNPVIESKNGWLKKEMHIDFDINNYNTVQDFIKDIIKDNNEYRPRYALNYKKLMNDKAKSLGMNDTTFKNSHGIDEDGHVTSAYDIAIMSRELSYKHPEIHEYTKIWMDTLREEKSQLVNTNKLIRFYSGATGLKTGSTSLALFNLTATATRNDMKLIAVVMKGPTSQQRFDDAKALLDYGFANDNITAPLEYLQKVGTINYKLNGEIIGQGNIVSSSKIEAKRWDDFFAEVSGMFFKVGR